MLWTGRCVLLLANCHMHAALDGYDWKAALARHRNGPDQAAIRQMLDAYRRQGYTFLRDGGDRFGACRLAKTLATEYGITYLSPGAPLYLAGHYGGFIGTAYESIADYCRLVREARQDGADFIKIMISGLMDFDRFGVLTEPSLPESLIRELITVAHDAGFAVMAHANGTEAVLAAARWGVDSVEHGAYLHPEALHAMVESGTVWVPTLSTVGNLLGSDRYNQSAVRRILEQATENVRIFHQMGGAVAPGDDAGAWRVPHGGTTELTYLQNAGISPISIETATQTLLQKFT